MQPPIPLKPRLSDCVHNHGNSYVWAFWPSTHDDRSANERTQLTTDIAGGFSVDLKAALIFLTYVKNVSLYNNQCWAGRPEGDCPAWEKLTLRFFWTL